MIADITDAGGGAIDAGKQRAAQQRAAINVASAQLSAALMELKQAQIRQDSAAASVKEAIEQLRRASR